MTLSDYLDANGLSDTAFASLVGLKSHTTINRLRRGVTEASVLTALEIERVTEGKVDAATLSSDVRKAREGCLAPATVEQSDRVADEPDFEAPTIECAICEAPARPDCRNRGCPHARKGA